MVDRMQSQGGSRQPQQRTGGAPAAPGGDNGFWDWLQSILAMGDQYQMSEEDITNLGNYMLYQQAYGQQQQYDLANQQGQYQQNKLDYDNRYLDFLYNELGYRGKQLDYAMEKDAMEREFFMMERPMQHEATMKGYESQMQQSADDVLRSANYLQQQRYGTEAAGYNRDIARFSAMQALGLAPNQRQEYVGSAARLTGY